MVGYTHPVSDGIHMMDFLNILGIVLLAMLGCTSATFLCRVRADRRREEEEH